MRLHPKQFVLYACIMLLFYVVLRSTRNSEWTEKNRFFKSQIDKQNFVTIQVEDIHHNAHINDSNLLLVEDFVPVAFKEPSQEISSNNSQLKVLRSSNGNSLVSSRMQAMRTKLGRLNHAKTQQTDLALVHLIRDYWILPPQGKPYHLEESHRKDFSAGQSGIIDNFLNHMEGGFFVECGALDGETRSNTLFLERERNWTGLLIEAGPINYKKLVKKNRNAHTSPACLSTKPYPNMVFFHRGKNLGKVIEDDAGLLWIRKQGHKPWLMEVQCFPLYSMLLALNRTRVDYFSLDVEGMELNVLKTIPFDLVDIRALSVEFIHDVEGSGPIVQLLQDNGYKHIATYTRTDRLANDLIFLKIQPASDSIPEVNNMEK